MASGLFIDERLSGPRARLVHRTRSVMLCVVTGPTNPTRARMPTFILQRHPLATATGRSASMEHKSMFYRASDRYCRLPTHDENIPWTKLGCSVVVDLILKITTPYVETKINSDHPHMLTHYERSADAAVHIFAMMIPTQRFSCSGGRT